MAITGNAEIWNDSDNAKVILKEKADLEQVLEQFKRLDAMLADAEAAMQLAKDSSEIEFQQEADKILKEVELEISKIEFRRKMSGEFDAGNAIIEFNSGSGGTEAQDWAEMLLRMYLRWAERKSFQVEELDYQAGDGAGIKRAALLISGPYAYGYLRPEQGVHRLVRILMFPL